MISGIFSPCNFIFSFVDGLNRRIMLSTNTIVDYVKNVDLDEVPIQMFTFQVTLIRIQSFLSFNLYAATENQHVTHVGTLGSTTQVGVIPR